MSTENEKPDGAESKTTMDDNNASNANTSAGDLLQVPAASKSRPKTNRNVSFANINWDPSTHRDPSRPSAFRSISFAHPARKKAPTNALTNMHHRPGAPPRALSFCDTRFTPSGPNLSLRQGSVSGPFAFLNPTTAIFDIRTDEGFADTEHPERGERARIRWNAREFRKGKSIDHVHDMNLVHKYGKREN